MQVHALNKTPCLLAYHHRRLSWTHRSCYTDYRPQSKKPLNQIIHGTNYLNIGRLKNLKKHVTPRHDHTPSPHTFWPVRRKRPQKTQRSIPKKIKNTVHNTTNNQIFSDKRIPHPRAPSTTAQNTKPRHGKAIKLFKPEKKRARRSNWWSVQLTVSSLEGKPKWSPTNFASGGSPTSDPPPCLPTSQPLRYSYITDSSLLQSTIKTQKSTFSFGFVAHHRCVTSSCCLSFLPLLGSRCVRGTNRNEKREYSLVSDILDRWQVEGWSVNYEYFTYDN